ncbi:MAG: hypothetical protein WD069_04900 [Planctomycetales bacterium]
MSTGSPPPERRSKRRRSALHLAALGATGLCTLLLFVAVWPIDPRSTFGDNAYHWFPAQRIVTADEVTLADLILTPFFRPAEQWFLVGHETEWAKPVYVAALRLWGWAYHTARPWEEFPNPFEIVLFAALGAWGLGYATWQVADRLGHPLAGLVAGVLVIGNLWQVNYLYMPHYSQLAAAILLCAFLQNLRATPRGGFIGGILSTVALLMNNAILVYLPGMVCAVALLNGTRGGGGGASPAPAPSAAPPASREPGRPAWSWKQCLAGVAAYVGGIAFVFAFFGAISSTEKIRVLCGGGEVTSPWTTLTRYIKLSVNHNHFQLLGGMESVPRQWGLFFEILRDASWMGMGVFAVAPFVAAWGIWRLGWRAVLHKTWLRDVAILLAVAVPAVMVIELGPGIQLGRSYFPAMPFWLLAAVLLLKRLSATGRVGLAVVGLLAVAYAVEFGFRSVEQHRGWHATVAECRERLEAGDRLLFLQDDGAAVYTFRNLTLSLAESGDSQRVLPLEFVDMRDLDRIAAWVREGRVLLLTSPEPSPTSPFPSNTPPESLSLMEKLRSGSGPTTAQVEGDWPGMPHPLYRYEDEYNIWSYKQGTITEQDTNIRVWELSAADKTTRDE